MVVATAGTVVATAVAVADAPLARKVARTGPGHGKADNVRSILRMGLSVVVATVLAASAAWAVDYDDIFVLTERDIPELTIVQLIVDDGRAFELSSSQLMDLRVAGVSEHVIAAMLDPEAGRAWISGGGNLGGDPADGGDTGNGYRSSLDQDYGPGEGEGAGDDGTPLVFSFGYYYGPLSRYYYDDPYYYPFWSSGFAYSYWPSYYAYGWRPEYDEYYAYPYNWYEYSSYYCHTYYDPAYWTEIGYTVQPGYGPTVWDHGPRFRGGGIVPPKGGRPDAVSGERLAVGAAGRVRNPAGPPAIRESESGRTLADRATRGIPASREIRAGEPSKGLALRAPGETGRWRTTTSAVADQRSRLNALRAARDRANAVEGAAWARRQSEQNVSFAARENERWAREWQAQLDVNVAQAAAGPPRAREPAATPPPPPAERAPARAEEPRNERVPAPDRGAAGGRGDAADDAGASRGGSGRGGR